ncbi:hypothetical protein [Chitinophaga sp. sic0106]|uniref:hypothetical protein n=1 Tax=Chitinophaga sp. sic0106 TaxID=2854785 RepID=UPI001C4399F2|nr:hypothetical protein [Chitinophaga sp. sic0106]MBV7531225.1 hypothetical protein [Chitinophaga sp. sic0106]
MKQISVAACLLFLAACSTKDPVSPITPPVKDSAKVEIIVYDGTKWASNKPYGEERAGVTVNLYKSQTDFAQNKVAYTRVTDASGKASFSRIPNAEYYIEAKLDTLTNMPVRNGNKGFACDSLFQQYNAIALEPEQLPYGGNFIYKDLNGDGLLNNNDYTDLPYQHIQADSLKSTSTRIIIGVGTNSEYQPFATRQAAEEALTSLYNDVHLWHQQVAVFDAVLTDDANCSGIPGLCEIDNYTFGAHSNSIASIWNNGINIINKANRIWRYAPAVTKDSITSSHAEGLTGYVLMQLIDLYGNAPIYYSLQPPANLTLYPESQARDMIGSFFGIPSAYLPHLNKNNPDRSRLSIEALQALMLRNDINNGNNVLNYNLPLNNDSAVVLENGRYNSYTSSNSREIIWGDTKEISNADLKTIFTKGKYLPIINLNQVITLQAEKYIKSSQYDAIYIDQAIGMLNMITARSGIASYPQPTAMNQQQAMEKVILQTRADQSGDGYTMLSLRRWNIQLNTLGPLGFKPYNALMPVPQSFVDNYPNTIQNPGY